MNSLHSLLISDNILLDPESLNSIEYLINKIRGRDIYSSLKWSDLADDENLASLRDRNTGRRYNFIEYFTEMVKGSINFPNLSGNQGHNQVLDYFLILIAAEDAGFFDMADFLNNKSAEPSVAAFLFLLNDGVSPSVKGFITLQRRIAVCYEAIRELKKTTLGSDFKIKEEFVHIRKASPMKTYMTESQIMIRALRFSKLKKELGDEFTPISYVSLASLILYKNMGAGPKEMKIAKKAEHILLHNGFSGYVYKLRFTEAMVFYVMKKGDIKFQDITAYLEKLFCVGGGGVYRAWEYEREKSATKNFRTELKKKYNKDTAKFAMLELGERTMLELGIKPKTKEAKENKMRGE